MTDVPGAVTIAPRALRATVRAAAAEAFGARSDDVRADVLERGRTLDLRIATPIRLGTGTVQAAAERSREQLLERAGALTGAQLGRCEIRITRCEPPARPRVR
ncbi:hypothetical protein AA0Z99_12055 [Agrococcus sp. 1P02AA]|uniref:hypothetical protein n=1 Tax=Agrococcus sp. 1P02AA TaxID=3132259 RepID=UPI0039A4081D